MARHSCPFTVAIVLSSVCLIQAGTPNCPSSGGLVIDTVDGPEAAFSFYRHCDGRAVVTLNEFLGRKPDGKAIYEPRARLEVDVPDDQWIFGCQGTGLKNLPIIAITTRPVEDWRRPPILRAWKADLHTWRFVPLTETPNVCRTHPPFD